MLKRLEDQADSDVYNVGCGLDVNSDLTTTETLEERLAGLDLGT